MYSERKHYGDDHSVAEELLANIPELEQQVQAVDKAVREGYFSLDQALALYRVSEIEYIAFLLLKNKTRLQEDTKMHQVLEAVSVIVQIFHGASDQFDPKEKKIMRDLEFLTRDAHLSGIVAK